MTTVAAAIAANKPYVKIPAGTYNESLLPVRSTSLIGVGNVVLTGQGTSPAVSPEGAFPAVSVVLQGVSIEGGGGGGVSCSPVLGAVKLTIVESTIKLNAGVGVFAGGGFCELTLRRSRVLSNLGGGVQALDTYTITNNLIAANGSSQSAVGGASLMASSLSTFTNNTVVSNTAKAAAGSAGGIACMGTQPTLYNNIVWGNGGGAIATCTLMSSNIQTSTPGATNHGADCSLDVLTFLPLASSQCADAGDSSAPGVGAIDLSGAARVQGAKVDMGAFEVK
ncbi:MAG: right-handed parallel beta-helix repeat-containing protein [Myxococcales bacterium]|nr:right-handed parallel beta-helix repeat-containing protein [Myxococcales bacterium]